MEKQSWDTFHIWDTWQGKRVMNPRGEIFIETKDADWQHRLGIWRNTCYTANVSPCPMPEGHIMFRNAGKGTSYYKPV